MRTIKRIALLILIIIVVFVSHLFITTGFFRSIENEFDGKILAKVALNGAEDIMICHTDSIVLISSTDRSAHLTGNEEKGGLFMIDLKANNFDPIPLTETFEKPFAPHGISFYKKDSIYIVMAINHADQEHTIEVFELKDKYLKHIETLKHPSMISPNDLVMIDENRFYFTNDHKYTEGFGRAVEEYLGLAVSNVVYYDSNTYQEAANRITYANGINYDRNRGLIYVASPRKFLVKVYSKQKDGSLSFIENISCGTGVDNIDLDRDGDLWIGSQPNLLRFIFYVAGNKDISPSEIIEIVYRDTGDYSVEKIYVEEGYDMSGSTVAATFGDLIFTGNAYDDNFLILERSNPELPN